MKQVKIQYLNPLEIQITHIEDGLPQQQIFLLGTAHVSEQSAKQTEDKISTLEPDCICVELDQLRYDNIQQKERWQNLDLFKTLKEGKGFLLLVNLLLASFQKRVGRNLAMRPGQEMICAIELAQKHQVHLELVDRPVEITLKRAWASCNLWQRAKLLNALLASLFATEEISEQDIENLKEANTLEHLMNEFANYLPSIKGSLIDERDVFLARSIAKAPGKKIFAVLGAGHLRGVCQVLEHTLAEKAEVTVLHHNIAQKSNSVETDQATEQSDSTTIPVEKCSIPKHQPEWFKDPQQAVPDLGQLLAMPAKSKWRKIFPWILPLLALGIMAAGFFSTDTEKALHGIGIWIVAHSALAGLAALLLLAHPLTILTAIITAPFTALNPTISVGLVSALAEILLRKPRVRDVENLLELEKWWQFRQNRIWHALMIFFIVSLGGAAATFIALPWLSILLSN